ncbi:hypothetical protein JKP88DRAFT_246676 [Tribonema minus]|uniref:Uncharacterized protein n=1 Tax=Tribonema minus TaxID=303371 RepID=A0A835YSD2_9STRA|nr:hypothetical protein JKP88DRAFT_246676 [Tribonema minus]
MPMTPGGTCAFAALWLLVALGGAEAAGNPPVLKSAEVSFGCTRSGVPTNAADAAKPQSPHDVARNKLCQADVVAKFDTANKNARGTKLELIIMSLLRLHGVDYTATKSRSDKYPQLGGLKTWLGEVKGQLGYAATKSRSDNFKYPQLGGLKTWLGEVKGQPGALATVVWDKNCDASKFFMDVKLPSVTSAAAVSLDSNIDMVATQLKAVPCSDSNGVDNCVWLAEVETALPKAIAKKVPEHVRRHLEEHNDTELEEDIELLAAVQRGDAEALDHFNRNGGRRYVCLSLLLAAVQRGDVEALNHFDRNGGRSLSSDGTVIMPSGRRLDDGSIVTLMYIYGTYTNASIVTLMYVYGTSTNAKWGSQVPSMAAAGVTSANQVLVNSGVGFQFQLVNLMYSNYADNNMDQATTDMLAGTVPGVAAARNTYGADLIQMMTEDTAYCGLGWLMTDKSPSFEKYGNSAVFNDCFMNLSHIHEIGHNMGCHHDIGTDGANAAAGSLWPYSFGYRYCSAPNFRTVMAYACTSGSASRMPYFSSPNVYYMGYPTGTDIEDNVRTLKDSKLTVSNFRLNGTTPTSAPTATPKPTTRKPTARRHRCDVQLNAAEVLLSPPGPCIVLRSELRRCKGSFNVEVMQRKLNPHCGARPTTPSSGYNIQLVFSAATTPDIQAAFTAAAARWQTIITGDVWDVSAMNIDWLAGAIPGVSYSPRAPLHVLPNPSPDPNSWMPENLVAHLSHLVRLRSLAVAQGAVDDIVIGVDVVLDDTLTSSRPISGSSQILYFRSGLAQPISGVMKYKIRRSSAAALVADGGFFRTVVLHTMAQVLGYGWMAYASTSYGKMASSSPTKCGSGCKSAGNPLYTAGAVATCNAQLKATELGLSDPLMLEASGSSACYAWSETQLCNELMTSALSGTVNPLSAITMSVVEVEVEIETLSVITIGAFQDLGYSVDYSKADAFNPAGCMAFPDSKDGVKWLDTSVPSTPKAVVKPKA